MRETSAPRQGQDLHYRDMDRFAAVAARHSELGGRPGGAGTNSGAGQFQRGTPSPTTRTAVPSTSANTLRQDSDLPDETPSSEAVLLLVCVVMLCAGMAFVGYAAFQSWGI
jgi:hypothetical protein